jgi:CPA2 family monovalent cation:H+ antiporter-2
MSGHFEFEHYREALIFLAIAGVVIPLVRRLRISPVIGFIVAGAALGPHALGKLAAAAPALAPFAITSADDVAVLAELGVVFLLFMIGLELSFERLWTMRRLVFGLGAAQVGLCGAALGAGAYVFGVPGAASIVVGACLALSSTAIVLELLAAQGRLGGTVGRTSFSILLFQDLAVVPILFVVAVLGASRAGPSAGDFGLALAQAAFALAAIVAAGRLVLRPLFRLVARTRSRELFMAATLFVVVGTAVATAASGLSMALGAFLAGLLMAETEFRREVEIDIEPFKGLLLGVFFLAVGMSLDLSTLASHAIAIVGAIAGVIALKAAITAALVRAFGRPWPVAIEVGVGLAGAGEFALAAFGLARSGDVLSAETVAILLFVVAGTMLATPALGWFGRTLGGRLRREEVAAASEAHEAASDPKRAIVIGYGRVGRLIGEMLANAGRPYVAVDLDADLVTRASAEGAPAIYGNAVRAEFLRRIGLAQAETVVVTLDDAEAAEAIVAAIRAERADVAIVARSRDAPHAARLYQIGATEVVPETLEASLDLARAALLAVGGEPARIEADISAKRQAMIAALRA